jgi:DNA processing protein
MDKERFAMLRLFLTGDLGSAGIFALLKTLGSAENVLKASKADLIASGAIKPKTAQAVLSVCSEEKAEREAQTAQKNAVKIIFFNDPDYPPSLSGYNDKPLALYVKGNTDLRDLKSVSIVGARNPSHYGKTATAEFASYFAARKVAIVSGLARGIDCLAHETALKNSSATIAVLGNGILVNYPPENARLQEKIAENGALISEFPLIRQPDKGSFPRRNRIIAALSKATLITEAALPSGSLITAAICAQYGKDVYAVPGSIYSPLSEGTNSLIRDGAFPALKPKDVFEQIFPEEIQGELFKPSAQSRIPADENGLKVLNIIKEYDNGAHIDAIAQRLSLDIPGVSAILLKLELDGFIKTLPGRVYVRN